MPRLLEVSFSIAGLLIVIHHFFIAVDLPVVKFPTERNTTGTPTPTPTPAEINKNEDIIFNHGAQPDTGRSDYNISEKVDGLEGGFLWPLRKAKDKTNSKRNSKLEVMYSYLQKERPTPEDHARHIDSMPFPARMISKHIRFPEHPLEQQGLGLPDVSPAPTGIAAYNLAMKFGYPPHWRARQRPQFFLLGPPKTGTTFLDACIRFSMTGNSSQIPYPSANARWPAERGPGGEPVYMDSPEMLPFRIWNRTGFRRWDPPKEWWTYPEIGRYADTIRGFINVMRFPPVEPDSDKWKLIDSTPDSLMIPKAAQALHQDLQGAPFTPTFLVTHRNAFDRAYSHYLLFSELRNDWGWGPETLPVFADRLDQQHKILMNITICKRLLTDPEPILESIDLTYQALRWCLYDPHKRNQVMYLPFGFTALGLNYWLKKFPADNFRLLKMTDLKKLNTADKLLTFSEKTFSGFQRVKPRCDEASSWNSGKCSGHGLYDKAMLFCSHASPALEKQAWTDRKGLKLSKGPPERLEKYRHIAEKWSIVLERMITEHGLLRYDPTAEEYDTK